METAKISDLQCPICKHYFNLKNREPIYLICCNQTACRECVETIMMKSESKEHVIKGQFDCSFCHCDHCAPEGFEAPIKLNPNNYVKNLIEKNFKSPLIFCDTHPE